MKTFFIAFGGVNANYISAKYYFNLLKPLIAAVVSQEET